MKRKITNVELINIQLKKAGLRDYWQVKYGGTREKLKEWITKARGFFPFLTFPLLKESKNACGYIIQGFTQFKPEPVHRLVAERMIGRVLKDRELVHHCNENKRDNRPSNLLILRHNTAHKRLHHFIKRNNLPPGKINFEQKWLTEWWG